MTTKTDIAAEIRRIERVLNSGKAIAPVRRRALVAQLAALRAQA